MTPKRIRTFFILTIVFALVFIICNIYITSFIQKRLRYKLVHLDNILGDSTDYLKLINISFTFTKLPSSCASEGNNFVILIHSKVSNFQKRRIIRETWGQYPNVSLAFMLALPDDKSIGKKLEEEFKHYDDIVQGNFLDSYRNMTYKHVMTLKYAIYHCRNIKYVLKTDDDIFLHTPALVKFFNIYKINDKIACFKFYRNAVSRTGKNAVAVKEYAKRIYPTHCSGSAIIYPLGLIPSLYMEAQHGEFFWIDDVYITGLVARRLGIELLPLNRLMLRQREISEIINGFVTRSEAFLFGGFALNSYDMKHLWHFAIEHPYIVDEKILLRVHP